MVGAGEIHEDETLAFPSTTNSPAKERLVLAEVSDNATLNKGDIDNNDEEAGTKRTKSRAKRKAHKMEQENKEDAQNSTNDTTQIQNDNSVLFAGQLALSRTQELLELPRQAGLDVVVDRLEDVMHDLKDVLGKTGIADSMERLLTRRVDSAEEVCPEHHVEVSNDTNPGDIGASALNEPTAQVVAEDVLDEAVPQIAAETPDVDMIQAESQASDDSTLAEVVAAETATPDDHEEDRRQSEVVQALDALFVPPTIDEAEEDVDESSIFDIISKVAPSEPATQTPHAKHQSPTKESIVVSPHKRVSMLRKSSSPRKPQNLAATTTSPIRKSVCTRSSMTRQSPSAIRENNPNSSGRPLAQSSARSTPMKASHATSARRPTISALRTPPALQKSARPLTKPSFQLPSDAITARLKAQREERLKRQEEEARKRTEFKARPMPRPTGTVDIKQNTASRLRMSIMAVDRASMPGLSTRNAPGEDRTARARTITTTRNTPGTAKPSPGPAQSGAKQVSAPVSEVTKAANQAATVPSSSAAPRDGPQARMSCSTMSGRPPVQRPDGREIFNRGRVELEEREKAMRDKAEAVRKAREAATERGRALSKEWAEKKRAAERKKREEEEARKTPPSD